jgi:hypothetical protein
MLEGFVQGDDVYADSEYGTSGWEQMYRVDPDGTPVLYRGKNGRHISAMTSDGSTLYWCESYGSTDPNAPPTTTEVWAAPYTNDPATLDATAHLVASIPPGRGQPGEAVAYGGLYAVYVAGTTTTIDVVRLSDGAVRAIVPDAGEWYTRPVFVSSSELWAVVSAANGPQNIALRRIPLGSW